MGLKDNFGTLKRELGLLDIFCIASGAMISSGLFILPGIAFADAGPSIIIAYLIASLMVIPAMFTKAELATAMPKAGGTYFFIDRSVGPLMGTIGGFAAWFSLAFKSAFALVGIGIFAVLLNPGFTVFQTKLIAVFFCVIFALINIKGVSHTGKIQIVLVLGLIILLIYYILVGLFYIDTNNFSGIASTNFGTIFSTAGLIFVSYGGLTKVCSIAGECKNPGRNLPKGIFLSWGIISLLYLLVITVTVGIVNPTDLSGSKWPISLGAGTFLGQFGTGIMAIAAILAFISTANAGILAASRDPMAMGKDQLIPSIFGKVNKRGTPTFSIIFTTIFMIIVILFLDLKDLIKTASLLKILLFLFVMISLIVMRESKIRNYQPKFRSPFYPYLQIIGIFGLIFLIIEMGTIPMLIVGLFILFSLSWYLIFARDKIWREYSLLHVVEKVTGKKSTGYLVDEELREVLIERDQLEEKRFEDTIKNCEVIDLYKYITPNKLALLLAERLTKRVDINIDKLYKLLRKKEKDDNFVIHPGIAIVSNVIKGREKFELIIVRSRMGIIISDNIDPIRAFFVIVSSKDKQSLYHHTLMWLTQIAEATNFEEEWTKAENIDELREIILKSWKKTRNF